MFRILVVEDFPPQLKLLETEIPKAFLLPNGEKGLKVYGAKSVAEGLELINNAHESGRLYQAAILDFKLPRVRGENAEMDESLCLAIKRMMPNALVVHFTGHSGDQFVTNHVNLFHLGRRGPEADVISKTDIDWPKKLELSLKGFLYGTLIEEQMNRLFGADYSAAPYNSRAASLPTRSQGERGLTHALTSLSRDIEAHWTDLDEGLQSRIKEIFRVAKYGDNFHLSLIRDQEKEE